MRPQQIRRAAVAVVATVAAGLVLASCSTRLHDDARSGGPVAGTSPRASLPSAGSLSLITEPTAGMTPIDAFMSSARTTLDLTMYELGDQRAEAVLETDAQRGVDVRVILDKRDEGASFNRAAVAALTAHGVRVRWGPADAIVHQKTVTVDDERSMIMTLNLTGRYDGTDRDFAVEDTDPSDVRAIVATFTRDWKSGNKAPLPGKAAPGLVWSPGAQPTLIGLIDGAHRSVDVENEEMADATVIDALVGAAHRGIDVEVTMTAAPSWDPAVTQLGEGGVHVHLDDDDSPLYIHAKVIVVDGRRAFVGSQNFSTASLDENRELGIVTSDPAIVASLATTLATDFAHGATGVPTDPANLPG